MKKIFAALCALLLVPTIASAGGERFSLSELKAQTPAAVERTHEAYGRTISFRAPVYVPDVDALPILRVKRTCISAQTAEALGDSLEKNTLYGQRAAMRPGGLAESEASHFTAYVQNLWTSAADEAAIFAPNQEKSLRDAEDFLARQTETLLGEQQIGCLPYRAGLRSERLVRDGAKKGGYYIEAWETLHGIPVVTGVERTFSRQSGRAVQQALSNASWIVLGEYRSDADYIWMATAMWREIGEVQPDVPLCGWAQVERTLTDWIERGRIRNVYSVTLGYAAYAAPDRRYPDDETAYEAEYWLAPTWCVECKYAESAARSLTADSAEEDETEARGYQQLIGEYGLTQEQVADRVSKSRPAVANAMRLLSLPDELLTLVEEGKLTAGHARALLTLKDAHQQLAVAQKIINLQLSVRQTEAMCKKLSKAAQKPEPTPVEVDYLAECEKELSRRLGRGVKIVSGKRKGKIELEYYGQEDLQRLYEVLAQVLGKEKP